MEVPFDKQAWGAEECAKYIGISKVHFLTAIRYADGFPAPLPARTYVVAGKQRTMDPRWAAPAVAAWLHGESEQELHKSVA